MGEPEFDFEISCVASLQLFWWCRDRRQSPDHCNSRGEAFCHCGERGAPHRHLHEKLCALPQIHQRVRLVFLNLSSYAHLLCHSLIYWKNHFQTDRCLTVWPLRGVQSDVRALIKRGWDMLKAVDCMTTYINQYCSVTVHLCFLFCFFVLCVYCSMETQMFFFCLFCFKYIF